MSGILTGFPDELTVTKTTSASEAKIPSLSINCSITKDDLLIDLIFDLTTIKSSNINGFLYLEINPKFKRELIDMIDNKCFIISERKDIFGKDRMLRIQRI